MREPSRLVVVAHDRTFKDRKSPLESLGPNKDLLLLIHQLFYGKVHQLVLDESNFGAVNYYLFNELDVEEIRKCGDDPQKYVSALGSFFNDEMARRIFDDVERGLERCEGLIVSCNGGLVRSPLIAAALNDSYGWRFEEWLGDELYLSSIRQHLIYRTMIGEARRRGIFRN
jgi:hypothetical protein